MANREVYARAWVEVGGLELTVGVAIYNERPDQIKSMVDKLWWIARNALSQELDVYTGAAAYVEKRIDEFWPGRPYFIESEEKGRGVQVFQPWGLPVDHVAVPSPANTAARLALEIDMPGKHKTTFVDRAQPPGDPLMIPVSVPTGSSIGHEPDCHLHGKTLRGCHCGADHQ